MIALDASRAFDAYETARHRLPQCVARGAGVKVATLADIADRFDAFLLDAFGVLNIGESAIPGVPERIADLQAAGKRVLVLTNAASFPVEVLRQKYRRLGYDIDMRDVISSRLALLTELALHPLGHLGIVAPPNPGASDLEPFDYTFLADDPTAYRACDAFVLLSSKEWSQSRQNLLEDALRARSRPVWVGNPDIVAPREYGFSTEPGYYAHQLADRTGIEPRFFGKPFGNIYDLAFSHLTSAVPRDRILMVGDSLHTDVLGANSAGIAAALVTGYGFFSDTDAMDAINRSGIRPDFILQQP